MNMDRLYPVVALLLLAALTIWLERSTRAPDAVQRIDRTNPDFIGDNVRIARFDGDGQLSYELDADYVTHFPASDITEFERPQLRYHSPKGQTIVTAAQGETHPQADLVELQGNVVLVRKNPDGDALTITSESLSLWPDAQKAATDSPVLLKHGNITAYGEGMRADNLAGTLDLVGATRMQMPSSKRNRP
jgi:lipopolysaccharide export system protein LptC